MRLIPLLIWYDEPAWCLAELVSSLARAGADHIVAVDGAFALYPEARPQSPAEQAQTIMAVAQGAGMGVTIHTPQEVWFGNEIEKRTFAFDHGHLIAEAGKDWFWIIDADELVTESLGLREALERSDCDAAEVIAEMMTPEYGREGILPIRRLFRAQAAGIRLVDNHYTYWSGDKLLGEGFRVQHPDLVEAEALHFVRMDHRHARSPIRKQAAQTYYARRQELRAEVVPA